MHHNQAHIHESNGKRTSISKDLFLCSFSHHCPFHKRSRRSARWLVKRVRWRSRISGRCRYQVQSFQMPWKSFPGCAIRDTSHNTPLFHLFQILYFHPRHQCMSANGRRYTSCQNPVWLLVDAWHIDSYSPFLKHLPRNDFDQVLDTYGWCQCGYLFGQSRISLAESRYIPLPM